MQGLAATRSYWEWEDDEDVQLNFYVWQRGGADTARRKGVGVDVAAMCSRAHTLAWRRLFKAPTMKSFSHAEHGELGSNELAREWCRRMSYYFELWRDAGEPDPDVFSYENQEPYEDPLAFVEWAVTVDVASSTWDRITELRSFLPGD